MSPPVLPDFPFLTATAPGTDDPRPYPPPPPSADPSPLRDPRTGTLISPVTRCKTDRLRQRLKLVRLRRALKAPVTVAHHVESIVARREVRYAALHADRLAAAARARQERLARWLAADDDPFAAWETPAVLTSDLFYRPPVPASVAAVSGIPDLAWRYGEVCMEHGLREDLDRPGRAIPVFAGEVRSGMGVLEKFDPVRRPERTERFDVARFERAVALESVMGKRDRGVRCLRCVVQGLPCSFERMRGREKTRCEGCRRNGCKFCLGVWDPNAGVVARYRYVKAKMTRGLKETVVVVFVKDEERVDDKEVKRYAEELMEVQAASLFGTTLEKRAVVLPEWKDTYCKTLKTKRELDKNFIEEWTGEEVPQAEVETEAITWQDYFHLLDEKWRSRHPYQARGPEPQLSGKEAFFSRK